MATYLYCCPRGKAQERVFHEADVPEPRAELALPRDFAPAAAPYRVCIHEAAHASCSIALGARVFNVTVDGRFVSEAVSRGSAIERASVYMIGILAENRLKRWRRTASNDDVIELLDEAAAGICGRTCDDCNVARLLSYGASDEEVAMGLAAFRQAEALALRMIDDPAFWGAVIEIADRLERDRTVPGPDVHEIAERHFAAGSFSISTATSE